MILKFGLNRFGADMETWAAFKFFILLLLPLTDPVSVCVCVGACDFLSFCVLVSDGLWNVQDIIAVGWNSSAFMCARFSIRPCIVFIYYIYKAFQPLYTYLYFWKCDSKRFFDVLTSLKWWVPKWNPTLNSGKNIELNAANRGIIDFQ